MLEMLSDSFWAIGLPTDTVFFLRTDKKKNLIAKEKNRIYGGILGIECY